MCFYWHLCCPVSVPQPSVPHKEYWGFCGMDHQTLPACVWLYPWVWRLCQLMHFYLWHAFNMCSHAILCIWSILSCWSLFTFTEGRWGSKNFYQLWSSWGTVGRDGTSAGMQKGKCEESAYPPHLLLCEAEASNLSNTYIAESMTTDCRKF